MRKELTLARTNYLIREIRRLDLTTDAQRAKSAKRLETLRDELAGPYGVLVKERERLRAAAKLRIAAKRKAKK
jgi:transcription-repair coupling factor (superfamily II helicase)